ncbi:MAG: hypothetical protein HW403_280 [Dehalococcoidia bacterium]|nr:hypothetical protein [Dehalococcoidia bacterium]
MSSRSSEGTPINTQRLRLTFTCGEEVKYISHLDMMRFWERALRRASLPLAYSVGFSPHPRISIAAPLAVGYTSSGELMDVFLDGHVPPRDLLARVNTQLPKGVDLLEAEEANPLAPSLQSLIQAAEYMVRVNSQGRSHAEVDSSIREIMARETMPWEHLRDSQLRSYDLRALILDLWLAEHTIHQCMLGMRLKADSSGAGRPEQVAQALGFSEHPISIHRTRIILQENNRERTAPGDAQALSSKNPKGQRAGDGKR